MKNCGSCKHFQRTGVCPQGAFKDGGICHANATDRYTHAGCDVCELYSERTTEKKGDVSLEESMNNALIKAAVDGNTAETILHMVWFCEYLKEEMKNEG